MHNSVPSRSILSRMWLYSLVTLLHPALQCANRIVTHELCLSPEYAKLYVWHSSDSNTPRRASRRTATCL